MTRVAIVGAGVVGAACAYYASRAGLDVVLVDRTAVAAGTSGAGEGNVLTSDKEPGAELVLARHSRALWDDIAADLGADGFELESKGGVVVARTADAMTALHAFADTQREQGVRAEPLDAQALHDIEPELAAELPGGMWYPDDAQVNPMLAAARLAGAAQAAGAHMRLGAEVQALRRTNGRIVGLDTNAGRIDCDAVVNAAGTWSGELAARLEAPIPVQPRRGFVLVTEPIPPLVRHKVFTADYVANVASDDAGLETSSVVEGTRAGTVLIGASRERVGFDTTVSIPVVRRLARLAVELFPVLAGVDLMRVYSGLRPFCPDHLPVIGADPRVPGLFHASGHEGSGIGLAPATGELVTTLIAGGMPAVDPVPYRPERFVSEPVGS